MLHIKQLTGKILGIKPKTLCLTFDDGPGNDTWKIGEFLQEQMISATFFMVGKFMQDHIEQIKKLILQGHIIGNHTFSHEKGYPHFQTNERDNYITELSRTNSIIKTLYSENIEEIYFRAPYGEWMDKYAGLNILTETISKNLYGPIYWDIENEGKWNWWLDQWTPVEYINSWYDKIKTENRGIILMHDHCADQSNANTNDRIANNKTLDVLRGLIPMLKNDGYQFISLQKLTEINNMDI